MFHYSNKNVLFLPSHSDHKIADIALVIVTAINNLIHNAQLKNLYHSINNQCVHEHVTQECSIHGKIYYFINFFWKFKFYVKYLMYLTSFIFLKLHTVSIPPPSLIKCSLHNHKKYIFHTLNWLFLVLSWYSKTCLSTYLQWHSLFFNS